MSAPAISASDLADIVLPDHEGRDVRLGDLWRDRATVLVWLRHYGWLHCRDHAVQLHRAAEQFRAAGAELVLVGMGSVRQATWFRGKFAPGLPVLADDDRVSYRAAGLGVGSVGDLVGPKSVLNGVRHAARSGVMQGRPVGNVAQLGGAVVVAPGGEVRFQHRSANAGDSVEPRVLLAALESHDRVDVA